MCLLQKAVMWEQAKTILMNNSKNSPATRYSMHVNAVACTECYSWRSIHTNVDMDKKTTLNRGMRAPEHVVAVSPGQVHVLGPSAIMRQHHSCKVKVRHSCHLLYGIAKQLIPFGQLGWIRRERWRGVKLS